MRCLPATTFSRYRLRPEAEPSRFETVAEYHAGDDSGIDQHDAVDLRLRGTVDQDVADRDGKGAILGAKKSNAEGHDQKSYRANTFFIFISTSTNRRSSTMRFREWVQRLFRHLRRKDDTASTSQSPVSSPYRVSA